MQPLLAITMGDPAGIGPETIVGAWKDPAVHDICCPLVVGNCEVMRRAAQLLNVDLEVVEVSGPDQVQPQPDRMPCLSAGSTHAARVPPAALDARGGQAAYDAVAEGVRLALNDRVDGLVTAPLNKAALQAAGHDFPGHTELLAHLCGVDRTAMMLYLAPSHLIDGPAGLGIVHVTLHMALRDVFQHLEEDEIVAAAQMADAVMRRLRSSGVDAATPPRIGVCALNPHAGEQGIFGDEEQTVIAPAVAQALELGIDVSGPYPADTLLSQARRGKFDAVVAMYHDQGHIALKLLDMHNAVNITLGLPIIRTSVAYGTAFDRAWQGTAESSGMLEAIRVAVQLARSRQSTMAVGNLR